MAKENKTDLCIFCIHSWKDFPLPLDKVIFHCEISDKINGFKSLNDVVPYPCTKCPFDLFVPKNYGKGNTQTDY